MTVGYSAGGGVYEKTLYVFCNKEKGRFHNFMRGPDDEKSFTGTLRPALYITMNSPVMEKIGLTFASGEGLISA